MKYSVLLGSVLVSASLLFGCQSNTVDTSSSVASSTSGQMTITGYEIMAKKMIDSISDDIHVTSASREEGNSIIISMNMGDIYATKADYYMLNTISDMDSTISELTKNVGDVLHESGFTGIFFVQVEAENGDIVTGFGYDLTEETVMKVQ